MIADEKKEKLTDSLPSPQIVRARLGETLREASLLRQLLRISVKAQEYSAYRVSKTSEVARA